MRQHLTTAGIADDRTGALLRLCLGISVSGRALRTACPDIPILERYQVKTDKASGIVNDPNDWSREVGDPRYIVDLLARIVTVSVETVRIVEDLPPLAVLAPGP